MCAGRGLLLNAIHSHVHTQEDRARAGCHRLRASKTQQKSEAQDPKAKKSKICPATQASTAPPFLQWPPLLSVHPVVEAHPGV